MGTLQSKGGHGSKFGIRQVNREDEVENDRWVLKTRHRADPKFKSKGSSYLGKDLNTTWRGQRKREVEKEGLGKVGGVL